MANMPITEMVFRTGVVRAPDTGYLIGCNPDDEEDDPHAWIIKWSAGSLKQTRAAFNAHSICLIRNPELALVFVAGNGLYGIHAKQSYAGNIFTDSRPLPTEPRFGDIRWVTEIDRKAYAAGHMGAVYRLDAIKNWTRIDEGLPRELNIEAIHGFGAADVYVGGKRGYLWHWDGSRWTNLELPTNVHLTRIKCAPDGVVYVAGHKGLLLRGRHQSWSIVDHGVTTDTIWSLEWFNDQLYVATRNALFRLSPDTLEAIDFGGDPPKTFYHLSAVEGVMWSIGEEDVMSFDGARWKRIV
jgi:hypothetical protein